MKPQGYLIGGLLMAVASSSFAQGSDEYGFSREEMCALTAETAPDTDYTVAYEACMSGSASAPMPQPSQQYDDNPDVAQEPEPEQPDGSQGGYDGYNEPQDGGEYNEPQAGSEYNEQQSGNEYSEQQDSNPEESY